MIKIERWTEKLEAEKREFECFVFTRFVSFFQFQLRDQAVQSETVLAEELG